MSDVSKLRTNKTVKIDFNSILNSAQKDTDLAKEIVPIETETVDLTEMDFGIEANSSNLENLNSNLSNEYQSQLDKYIKEYESILEPIKSEITDLESLQILFRDYEQNYEQTKSDIEGRIAEIAVNYKLGYFSLDKLNELGVTYEELIDMSVPDLIELCKEKDSSVIALVENLENYKTEIVDKIVQENSEFQSYEEFMKRLTELKNDQSILQTAIHEVNKEKRIAPYKVLFQTEEFLNYQEPTNLSTPYLQTIALSAIQKNSSLHIKNAEELYNLAVASTVNPNLGKMYNYLYETEGEESATKYLKAIEETVNQINGELNAKKFLNSLEGKSNIGDQVLDHLKTTGKGLESGLTTFSDGFNAWLERSDVYTINEYETMYILNGLQDPKYQALLDNNFEISSSIGNMLPSIAISLLNPTLGTISMGVSAGGNSYHSALAEGQSEISAITYGVLSGVSEATLERAFGGIPGLSDVKVTGLKTFAQSMLKEGIEEGTQEYVDALLKSGLFGEEIDLIEVTQNAQKSALYGAITGGILNTPNLVNGIVNINKQANVNVELQNGQNLNELNNEKIIKLEDLKYSKHTLLESVSKTLESNLKKYVYTDTKNIEGLNSKIIEEGLYHFTLKTDEIIKSGSIEPSSILSSYGLPKVFFFSGIPSVGAFATNLDVIPLTTTAVKIKPNQEIVNDSKLKVRYLDDGAISYDGKFDLSNNIVSKEFFVLIKVGDELVYKQVSQEIYNNYAKTLEGKSLQEFLNNKQNIRAIKDDYLINLFSKKTNEGFNANQDVVGFSDKFKDAFFDKLLFSRNEQFSQLGDNTQAVETLFNSFNEVYKNGDEMSKNIVSAFLDTKNIIQIFPSENTTAYMNAFGALSLQPTIDNNVLLHEVGHYYFHQLLDGQMPEHFDQLVNNAKKHALEQSNIDFIFEGEKFENARYLNLLEKMCSLENKNNKDIAVMSDILSGIHFGAPLTGPNGPLVLPFCHNSQYYMKRDMEVKLENIDYNKVFDEQFANFFSLYLNNKTEQIDVLRKFLGEDWYNSMMDTLKKINDISLEKMKANSIETISYTDSTSTLGR